MGMKPAPTIVRRVLYLVAVVDGRKVALNDDGLLVQ